MKTIWMRFKKLLKIAVPVGFIGLFAVVWFTHITPLFLGFYQPYTHISNLMIKGYDTVSIHDLGKAVKGSEQFTSNWDGVTWHFSSQENLKRFEANPQAFAPQFGGNCAKAVSSNMTALGDPNIWYLHQGKLYLFFNQHAKDLWVGQLEQNVVAISHDNWQRYN